MKREKNWYKEADLDNLIKEVVSLKKKDFIFPSQERVFTPEIRSVSRLLENMHFPFNIKYHAENINRKSKKELLEETRYLLHLLYGKKEENKVAKKIESFLKKVEIKEENRDVHTADVTYIDQKRPSISSISIAPMQSSLQSITLARTIVGSMKNESYKEFASLWKTEYTIPFFLEEYFAEKLSKEKGNEDILDQMRLLRMWSIQVQNFYYQKMRSIYNHETIGVNAYKARMYMTLHTYPVLKGYIDALKLLEIVKLKNGNVGPIVKEIREVWMHSQTTNQMLNNLKVQNLDSKKMIKERCNLIKDSINS